MEPQKTPHYTPQKELEWHKKVTSLEWTPLKPSGVYIKPTKRRPLSRRVNVSTHFVLNGFHCGLSKKGNYYLILRF